MQIRRCLESESGDDLSDCIDALFANLIRSCSLHRSFSLQFYDINGFGKFPNTDFEVWIFVVVISQFFESSRQPSHECAANLFQCITRQKTSAVSWPGKRPVIKVPIPLGPGLNSNGMLALSLSHKIRKNRRRFPRILWTPIWLFETSFLGQSREKKNSQRQRKRKQNLLAAQSHSIHQLFLSFSRIYEWTFTNESMVSDEEWHDHVVRWKNCWEKNFSGVLAVMPSASRFEVKFGMKNAGTSFSITPEIYSLCFFEVRACILSFQLNASGYNSNLDKTWFRRLGW